MASPEYNVQEKLQDRERTLLMRWLNTRLELQQEARTSVGKRFYGGGGLWWDIRTLDSMITMSIPRFRSLGMEEENKFLLNNFSDMLNNPVVEVIQ